MLIREFKIRHKDDIPDEVVYAGSYLERHGEVFGLTFTESNAVDKAAEMLTVLLDEDFSDWKAFRDVAREFGEWVEYHG